MQAYTDDQPGGRAKQEERNVVDPMTNSICSYAVANNWQPACPICPTPTPIPTPTLTPTPTPPQAPTATAATSVTSTGFAANRGSIAGAPAIDLTYQRAVHLQTM